MKFHFEQLLAAPIQELFAFHEDPANLALVLAGWDAFRILHHQGNIRIGSRSWFEVCLAGFVPIVLGFEHTIYEPPRRFGEELFHGPFRCFEHLHEFEETAQGTVLRDLLMICLPAWYGGETATELLVAPAIRRAFALRSKMLQKVVADRFGASRVRNSIY